MMYSRPIKVFGEHEGIHYPLEKGYYNYQITESLVVMNTLIDSHISQLSNLFLTAYSHRKLYYGSSTDFSFILLHYTNLANAGNLPLGLIIACQKPQSHIEGPWYIVY